MPLSFTSNFRPADEDGATLDDQVPGLHITEKSAGGFELNDACGSQVGDQFASDFSAPDAQDFGPTKVLPSRNNKLAGRETAFDVGGGMDFERAPGHELADEAALDDGVAHDRIGVEEIAFLLEKKTAVRAEIF